MKRGISEKIEAIWTTERDQARADYALVRPIITLRNVLVALAFIVALFVFSACAANSARSEDFYILPRVAADWTAWAAWLGLVATASAVVYAALQFRSDAEEKRKLRENREADAREAAKYVKVDLNLQALDEDIREISGVSVKITNWGKKPVFNVQVKIPDVAADITGSDLAAVPPDDGDDPPFAPEDPIWSLLPVPFKPNDQEQRWLCANIPERSILRIHVQFHEIQSDEVWGAWKQSGSHFTGERKGRITVIFDDEAGRSWARASEGTRQLQRLWP